MESALLPEPAVPEYSISNHPKLQRIPSYEVIRAALNGQSPRQRGRDKRVVAAGWTFLFHATTSGIVKQLLKLNKGGYAARLIEQGVLKRVSAPCLRSGKIYMLTPDGISLAEKVYPDFLGTYNTDPSSIHYSRLKHDLAAQLAVLGLMSRFDVSAVIPERLLGAQDVPGGKRPDVVLLLDDEEDYGSIWLEMELNAKKIGRERDMALIAVVNAAKADESRLIVYVTDSPAIEEAYRSALSEAIPVWKRGKRSTRWELTGETVTASEEVLERIEFVCRPNLLDPLNA